MRPRPVGEPLRRAPRLSPGDTVGIVAPAGPLAARQELTAGLELLARHGYRVQLAPGLLAAGGYLAGTDQERAAGFMALATDPAVRAVVALRGGYGCLRLLPLLPFRTLARQPKIYVGFSDLTVLLTAILARTRLVTFHGPMATGLPRLGPDDLAAWLATLASPLPPVLTADSLRILVPGHAQGRLLGGNLTNLVHLVGTPWELSFRGAILFLEDVHEATYRVDRLLTHLAASGRLQGLAGLILGEFVSCGEMAKIEARACELVAGMGIPVWSGLPVGHGGKNRILPLGVRVEMDAAAGALRFLEPCLV
ncbi:MAG: LD-carboxypeptidase [Thermodesulfobacteriota bacterium]